MPQKSLDEIFGNIENQSSIQPANGDNKPKKSLDEIFGDLSSPADSKPNIQSENPNLLTKPLETLGKSGGEFIKNTFSAIGHPIETLKSIGTVAKGGIEKLIPGEQPDEESFNNLMNFYKERYGGIENVKKTALEDPVGFASDLSMFLTGGGAAIGKVGSLAKVPQLATAGKTLGNIGSAIDPIAAATKGLGTVAEKVTAGKKLAPKLDQPVVDAAKALNIDLPASAKTKGAVAPLVESIVGKNIFGQEFIDKIERAKNSLNAQADAIIEATGKSDDLASAGSSIIRGADRYRKSFMQIKNDLYDKANIDFKAIKVTPTESYNFINTIFKKKQSAAKLLGKSEDLDYFRNLAKSIEPRGATGKFTSRVIDGEVIKSAINELNNKLKNLSDPVVTGNKSELKKLVTLMSQDLDSAIVAQNPTLAESIAKANQFYSEGINKLNSHYGKKIFDLKNQPDKILPAIINKSASIEDIPQIYSLIGQDNIPAVQAAFLENMFKSARSVETKTFTPAGLLRQIDSFGVDKLKAILTDDQFKAVNNIAEVARGLGKAEKIMGGSQTAFLIKTFKSFDSLFHNPLLGIKILGGDALLSKFVSSKAGQDLLTQGINFEQAGKKVAETLKTNAKGIGQKANLLRTGGIIKNESK